MDALQKLLIADECERLSYNYARWIDLGQAARAAELFTDDAELVLTAGPMVGREEIDSFFAKRQTAPVVSRHVITNVIVDVLGEQEASGMAYITFYRQPLGDQGPAPVAPPVSVGHYDDTYRLTAAGWRFSSRRSVVAFRS